MADADDPSIKDAIATAQAELENALCAAGRIVGPCRSFLTKHVVDAVMVGMHVESKADGQLHVAMHLGRTSYRRWPVDMAKFVEDVCSYVDDQKTQAREWDAREARITLGWSTAHRINGDLGLTGGARLGAIVDGEGNLKVSIVQPATEDQARRLLAFAMELGLTAAR